MRKSMIALIFISILLGGIVLSVILVAEPESTKEEPGYYRTPSGLAYGIPSVIAEKYGISVSELKPGEPPTTPSQTGMVGVAATISTTIQRDISRIMELLKSPGDNN
jgi:hypothetical protein